MPTMIVCLVERVLITLPQAQRISASTYLGWMSAFIKRAVNLSGNHLMTRANLWWLNSANPLAVVPNGFDGSQVARVEDVFRGGKEFALFQIVVGVAGADGDELQHARVAVAVNHAARAAVADELGIVPVIDLAHGRFPEVTAVKVQVPVEIKIFVPAEAAELFLFTAQMPLHF